MTCNPFASAAIRYSPSILRPEDLNIQNFQDVINYDLNPVNRFNRERLNIAVKSLNDILKRTDLSNLSVLNEKIKQTPMNKVELAEFLELTSISVEEFQDIIDKENERRNVISGYSLTSKGVLSNFNLVDYSRENPPGIYKNLPCVVEGLQQNISALCKITIYDDCSFTGVIIRDSDFTSINQQIEYKMSGYIEAAEGIKSIVGTIKREADESLSISGLVLDCGTEKGTKIYDGQFYITEEGAGSGASFDVIIGNNGIPLINISNPGSDYQSGDVIIIDEVGVKIEVTETVSLVNPVPPAFPDAPPEAIVPVIPISDFASPAPTDQALEPAQPYVDLLNSMNNYLDESYGSSITSGSCSSFNLSILGELFNLFGSLNTFIVQTSDLSQEIWNSAQEFATSLPSLLGVLKESFMKLIDNLMNQARQTLERLISSISSLGSAVYTLGRDIINASNFFSEENGQQIKNLVNSIMQNMNNQFNNPAISIIEWILTRLCQLSDFITQFLSSPIDAVTSLVTTAQSVQNAQLNISTANISAATAAGVVRLSPEQLRAEAAAAAERSNQAGFASGDPASSTPPRITPFPISDADLVEVRSVVTENGWPGIFTFSSSVINNNIDANGSELAGAGWRVVVRDNPALFAKIKKVIQQVGGGPYQITSAFRSEEYNRRLRDRGVNAALRSAHTEALALDIVMSASQAVRFVPIASANDFNGIAYYVGDGFLHVDLRTWRTSPGNRSWEVDSLSGELRRVINNHQNQLYRR